MKILITGVNGFIGTKVYNALAPDHEVLGIGRRPTGNVPNYKCVNVLDFSSLERLFAITGNGKLFDIARW